jgi:hypothetical protein
LELNRITTLMKDIRVTIQINRPIADVFAFTINPKNTPLYVDSVVAEETNEWPVKLGTIYRNKTKDSEWSEYTVIEFKENELFALSKKDNGLLVRYTFKQIDGNTTELKYYVQKSKGEIDEPFIKSIVDKLKIVLEK